MRIAVLILGIFATMAITFQSCTVGVLGTVIAANENRGAQGIAVALFYLLGTAFAYGLPFVAAPCFCWLRLWALRQRTFPT
jgi:cytochrome c biogenesis protein CcdA